MSKAIPLDIMATHVAIVGKTERELAWAAGLFEGEGTITIAVRRNSGKAPPTYRLQVMVGNTDEQVVDFFHTRWSGWKHPFYGAREGRKPGHLWSVTGPRAEAFLRELRPFLMTQRVIAKLDLALAFREAQSRSKNQNSSPVYKARQEALYWDCRELNRRGTKPLVSGRGELRASEELFQ